VDFLFHFELKKEASEIRTACSVFALFVENSSKKSISKESRTTLRAYVFGLLCPDGIHYSIDERDFLPRLWPSLL